MDNLLKMNSQVNSVVKSRFYQLGKSAKIESVSIQHQC